MWGMALPGSVAVPVRSRTGLPVCHRGAPVCAVVVTSSSSPQGSAGQPGRPGPPGHRGQAVSRGNPPREGVGGCWVRGRHPLRMGCAGSDPAVFPQGLPGQPGSKGGPGDKVGVGLSPQPRPPPVSPSCVPLPSCSPFGAGGDRDPMLSASVCPQGEVGARGQPGITGAPGQLVSKDPNDPPPAARGRVFPSVCCPKPLWSPWDASQHPHCTPWLEPLRGQALQPAAAPPRLGGGAPGGGPCTPCQGRRAHDGTRQHRCP